MGKHDSAPTYGWVFTSWLNRWVVRLCLLVTVCLFVAGVTIVARLDADCQDKPEWTLNVGSYDVKLSASKACDGRLLFVE